MDGKSEVVEIARSWTPRANLNRNELAGAWPRYRRWARCAHPQLHHRCTLCGLYVEAYLNHIVRVLKKRTRFTEFMGRRKHPGLNDKLAWFYNDFVLPQPARDRRCT